MTPMIPKRRAGRKPKHFTTQAERAALIAFLQRPASTYRQAADAFGCSESTIEKTVKRLRDRGQERAA